MEFSPSNRTIKMTERYAHLARGQSAGFMHLLSVEDDVLGWGPGLREIRWHDLRHSFASQLVSLGVALRRVQEWLGHSTTQMTMRILAPRSGSGANLIRALEDSSVVANTWQRPERGSETAV
jgi:integrase